MGFRLVRKVAAPKNQHYCCCRATEGCHGQHDPVLWTQPPSRLLRAEIITLMSLYPYYSPD